MEAATPATAEVPAPSIAAFRGPPFCTQEPSMWFSLLEINFSSQRITSSLTKFTHATSLIPHDILTQVSDVITTAIDSKTPYEDLRAAILARLQSSVTSRLQELLSKEELGNKKPSDLLRRMKKLLGEKYQSFDAAMFRHLFYQRLPTAVQQNIFSVKNKLTIEELAELADEFTTSLPVKISAINTSQSPSTDISKLTELVTQLTLEVNSLKEQRSRPYHNRSPSCKRCRSQSRKRYDTQNSSYCFYHDRFGHNARKCRQPCSFKKSSNIDGEH